MFTVLPVPTKEYHTSGDKSLPKSSAVAVASVLSPEATVPSVAKPSAFAHKSFAGATAGITKATVKSNAASSQPLPQTI